MRWTTHNYMPGRLSPPFLRKLSSLIDKQKLWMICYGADPIDLLENPSLYGLAVDIGTTTVAVSLIDLCTGAVCAEDGFINPQKALGPA